MDWQKKKRARSPPPAPKRTPQRATGGKARALASDDDDWLLGAGPPVSVGAPCKLTCKTTSDVEVASITSAAVPVRVKATAAAKPPASFEQLLIKYLPLSVHRLACDDDWLKEGEGMPKDAGRSSE
jgi:hypothetical protein